MSTYINEMWNHRSLLTSMTRFTWLLDSLQSSSATTFSWCSSVNSLRILISLPSRFCDLLIFFLVMHLMATGELGCCNNKKYNLKREHTRVPFGNSDSRYKVAFACIAHKLYIPGQPRTFNDNLPADSVLWTRPQTHHDLSGPWCCTRNPRQFPWFTSTVRSSYMMPSEDDGQSRGAAPESCDVCLLLDLARESRCVQCELWSHAAIFVVCVCVREVNRVCYLIHCKFSLNRRTGTALKKKHNSLIIVFHNWCFKHATSFIYQCKIIY